MIRVTPWDDPNSCGTEKRSRPSTRRPRRASSNRAALPIPPTPTTIASKRSRRTHRAYRRPPNQLRDGGGAQWAAHAERSRVGASTPPGAAAPASDSAHEQADHEEQGRDDGQDEQPLDREPTPRKMIARMASSTSKCHSFPALRGERL